MSINSRQMVEMECSSSISEDMTESTSAFTDLCRGIPSDSLSHPVVSKAVDSVRALVETIEPANHYHVQRLVKDTTEMMAELCLLSLKPGWPGAHLEETTKTFVKTLKPIQDVAKGYVEKNVVLRAIAIKDRRKMKKYRKYLARLRERLLLKSLLHISIPSRNVAEEPIRTPSTETIMKLDDEATTGQQHPDDRGQVDQDASSEEQSTDVSATKITPGSARGTRKRMGGARTVNPTPIDPYGGDQPGGSVRHPTEPPPRRTGYFPRCYTYPPPTTVQVFFTPAIQSCIDYSRHRTTFGSYRNEGQHATNHGSSRPNNTYSAGPGPSNVDECLPPGTEPMTADNHWVPSHCDGCYQHAEVPITVYDSSSPRQRGEDMHVEVEATEATSNASLPSSRTTPAGPRL